jgi:hypothetical protein
MSIRFIAKDYYQALKRVEQLAAEFASAPMDKKPRIEEKLRKATAEKIHLRRILDGAIDNARDD